MAIPTDQDARIALTRIVAKRLKASRSAAGLSQAKAAVVLKHKGITQVSLAEDGQRLPPLLDMIKYADLYCVPLDFLLGRIDDPIAEAGEQREGLMVRAVAHSIESLFKKFTGAVSEHVSVSLSGQRQDRADLVDVIECADHAGKALKRIRELNPMYEELLGGATLDRAILQLVAIGKRVAARTLSERHQFDMIDRALDLESTQSSIEQFRLSFQVSETADAGGAFERA